MGQVVQKAKNAGPPGTVQLPSVATLTDFLRDDGTFAAPAGGGGSSGVSGTVNTSDGAGGWIAGANPAKVDPTTGDATFARQVQAGYFYLPWNHPQAEVLWTSYPGGYYMAVQMDASTRDLKLFSYTADVGGNIVFNPDPSVGTNKMNRGVTVTGPGNTSGSAIADFKNLAGTSALTLLGDLSATFGGNVTGPAAAKFLQLVGGSASAQGQLALYGTNGNFVSLQANAPASSQFFLLPDMVGSLGQFLTTDGGSPAQLSFTSQMKAMQWAGPTTPGAPGDVYSNLGILTVS